jgi:peptide/nickel transport system substrate-binding protein
MISGGSQQGGCSMRKLMLALAAMALAAAASPARADGGTLIWGMPAVETVLDPHVGCGGLTMNMTYQMFENLWEQDLTSDKSPTRIVPRLAKSWDLSADGTEYTFHLRDGVKFHDGTPFDADAVKWNFDRFWNEKAPQFYPAAKAYMGYFTKWIKDVQVVDKMTVKITLTQPNYEWLRLGVLSCGEARMVSPTAVKKYGNEEFARHPVGTGPFRFVEIEPGVKVVLERNPDYWGTPAKLDRIIFRPLEDPATRINALRAGEVNMIHEAPFDEIDDLKSEGFQVIANTETPSIWYIAFNAKNKMMQDKRIRLAINYAIDREGIAREVLHNVGKPEYGMLNPGTYAYDPGFKPFSYDPEKAKKLLAEAGYPNGLQLDFDIFQYGYGEVWEKWIQRDLKKVGIDAKLNKIEWQTYLNKWLKGMPVDLQMNEMGWGMATPWWTSTVVRCDSQPPGGFNTGWYCNASVDKLLDQAIAEPDQSKRVELYRQANQIAVADDVGYAPMFDYFQPVVLAPSVKGFVHAPEWWYDLSTVWIAK